MSCPLYPPSQEYFYPLGGTPAISLTQDLSPEQSADVLLLGCGDPRNIFYTLYADVVASSSSRKLDITCCDIEPAVLARNILLFTLLDDQEEMNSIWDIFYHFKIDDRATEILTRQSKRLYGLAQTIETWNQSSYGAFLKFLDTRTLAELRRYWNNYAEFPNLPASRLDKLVQEQTRLSQSVTDKKTSNVGPSRSAGMLWLQAADPVANLYTHYWKTGTLSMLAGGIKKARNLNPTFVYSLVGEAFCPDDNTFPQGFHLAPAFASIISDPMDPRASGKPSPTDTFKRQFKAWCDAFRKARARGCIMIRFYAGDATFFCRALDIHASTGSVPSHLFTSGWCADTINLDQLSTSTPPAPLHFDVIETSNLADHIGLLNLLLLARPLLKKNPASQSVLYTEQPILANKDGTTQPFSERILATIPTISALLGIAPLAWVSGFTPHSNVHESLASISQFTERIAWVDPTRGDHNLDLHRPVVAFEASDLARVMFGVYEKIFRYEQDISGLGSNIPRSQLHSIQTTRYHRETIAALFQLVKRRVCLKSGTWDTVVEEFLRSIRQDESRKAGMVCYEELGVQLHLYGVYTSDTLQPGQLDELVGPPAPSGATTDQGKIPPIICTALTVPRARLQVLFRKERFATPVLQCTWFMKNGDLCACSSVHAVWGKIINNSGANTTIEENPQGARGESDLIVLFWFSHAIPLVGDISNIVLAFLPNPLTTVAFIDTLGRELEIFSTELDDEQHVKLLPYWPTTTPTNSLSLQAAIVQFPTPTSPDSSASVLAVIGDSQGQPSVVSLTARVEISDPSEQQALLNGADVTVTQNSPCTMKLSIATYDHIVLYSYPISGSQHRLRVARKSHYVEVIVSVSEPLDAGGYALDRTPILRQNTYSPWNIHHIHIDRMPLLDARDTANLGWVNNHTGLQLSDRERAIMSGKANTKDTSSKLLGAIKDTIHSIPNHYCGTWGQKDSAFGLCEASGDIYAVLLIGGLRLDLASFTIVVDTAIIPIADETEHKMVPLLDKLVKSTRVYRLSAMGDEPIVWRKLLPAFIERCRTWSHKANCEYKSKGQIPVTNRFGESPICTCGQGIGFDGTQWNIFGWRALLPFATRAAISPLFPVPYIEGSAKTVEDLKRGTSGTSDAGAASRLEVTNKCWACGGPGSPSLLTCGKCKRAKYCSAACQRKDWKVHKNKCKAT